MWKQQREQASSKRQTLATQVCLEKVTTSNYNTNMTLKEKASSIKIMILMDMGSRPLQKNLTLVITHVPKRSP